MKKTDGGKGAVLGTKEVGELFRVGDKTVRRWIADKKVAYFRTPGGHYRLHEEDVREFLEACGDLPRE